MAEDPPFLRLPIEIRLQVYGYLYEPPEGKPPVEATFPIWGPARIWIHELELRRGNLYAACNSTKRSVWPMLQVCKLVNKELLDLLFERMLFTIFVSPEERDANDLPGPPRLGSAKNFTFWQRARRILIVNMDASGATLKLLPYSLGAVFRCFKSTPQDTTTHLYLHDDDELSRGWNIGRAYQRYGRSHLKSLTSLSKRTHFEFEIPRHSGLSGRDELVKFVDAAHGTAKFTWCEYTTGGTCMYVSSELRPERRAGVVLSTESVDRGSATEQTPSGEEGGPKRTLCWMSERSRQDASRTRARQAKQRARQERVQLNMELGRD